MLITLVKVVCESGRSIAVVCEPGWAFSRDMSVLFPSERFGMAAEGQRVVEVLCPFTCGEVASRCEGKCRQ